MAIRTRLWVCGGQLSVAVDSSAVAVDNSAVAVLGCIDAG